jgi:CRP/FNR family cyclic AMP-dependent transcriptional regulator
MKTGTHAPMAAAIEMSLIRDLDQHPFCKGLAARHIRTLSECAMQAEFARDEIVFREGDAANRFYLIKEGSVALESRAVEGVPAMIQTIGDGDVLGWSWLFPPYYWHFDARAVEPVKAIFLYGTRLRELCAEDKELGYEIMQRIAQLVIQRLQATRRQLAGANPRA